MKFNKITFNIICFLLLLQLISCAKVLQKTKISDHFEVVHFGGSLIKQAHYDFYHYNDESQREYIGSSSASEYISKHFGLAKKVFAISNDGERLIYIHLPFFAGKRSKKEGGIYLFEHGSGERLLYKEEEIIVFWRNWPKPIPENAIWVKFKKKEMGVFKRNPTMLLNTEGEEYPIGLHDATPIQIAAYYGQIEEVKKQIDEGADIAASSYWGYTALEIAMIQGHQDLAILLLNEGDDVSLVDKTSPLHMALEFRLSKVIDVLISKGININQKDKNGYTPLHSFADKGLITGHWIIWGKIQDYSNWWNHTSIDFDMVNYLVENGADINAKDNDGKTPFHLVVENMLDWKAPTPDTTFLKHLLNKGADINAKDNKGNTTLHIMARTSKTERSRQDGIGRKIEILLNFMGDNGAEVDLKNNGGLTPLQLAVQRNYMRTAEFLVANGADDSVEFVYHRGDDSVIFIYRGLPNIPGQTVREVMDEVLQSDWW